MISLYTLNKVLVVVTAALGLTFCSLLAYAQSGKGPHGGMPRGPEHLIAELGIGEQYRRQFLTIMAEQHQKRMVIHLQYQDARDHEKDAVDSLRSETLSRLATVLSDEQLATFEQMTQRHRRGHARR